MLLACYKKVKIDCVKDCMDYEVQVVRSKGRPKLALSEVAETDCQTQQQCTEDPVDHRD